MYPTLTRAVTTELNRKVKTRISQRNTFNSKCQPTQEAIKENEPHF